MKSESGKRILTLLLAGSVSFAACGCSAGPAGKSASGGESARQDCAVQETAPQESSAQDCAPHERQIFAMTTVMNLRAFGDDAEAALDEAEEEIRSLDALLSVGTEGSEVWNLNHSGGGTLSDDTAALTGMSLKLYEETSGAFDFTIYPIMELWGFTRLFGEEGAGSSGSEETAEAPCESETLSLAASSAGEGTSSRTGAGTDVSGDPSSESASGTGLNAAVSTESAVPLSENERLIRHVPSADEISALLPYVDSSAVSYDPASKKLTLPDGAAVDFGGIAKGYTSAKIMEIFTAHHLTGGLADLGGNIQVMGSKPDGSQWRVGIEDPADTSSLLGILTLSSDSTVITSGGYERYLVDMDGKRYSHIIDPSTGYPVDNDIESASIICTDGALADGLSTSLCVMGKEKAIEIGRAHV